MAYYNQQGSVHNWLGKSNFKPATKIYCDDCADTQIPGMKPKGVFGRHFETGFKWAPWYGGGTKCTCCGKAV